MLCYSTKCAYLQVRVYKYRKDNPSPSLSTDIRATHIMLLGLTSLNLFLTHLIRVRHNHEYDEKLFFAKPLDL